jgi:iron complex outermembrane recepter protein
MNTLFRRCARLLAPFVTLASASVGLGGDLLFQLGNGGSHGDGRAASFDVVFINRMQEDRAIAQPFQASEIPNPFEVSFQLQDNPFGGPAFATPEDLPDVTAGRSPQNVPGPEPNTVILSGTQAVTRDARDVGMLMYESPQAVGVSYFRRSSATNLFVRGYNSTMLQTQLNGQMWYQTRPDQDTIVNKIDSGIVSNVVVIPGPYSVMYGPGAAFIDIATLPTIRSHDGCVASRFRSVLNYDTNGQGYYARQAMDLGGVNYGVRANVGFRHMDDYRAGNGERFNSSFTYRDIDLAMSRDFADGSIVDFQYLRNDLTDAEFYGQPYDLDYSATNGFLGRYQGFDLGIADHLVLEGWYNQTQIAQGTRTELGVDNPGLRNPVGGELFDMTIAQRSYGNSYGGRSVATYGDPGGDNTRVGVDFRGIKTSLQEQDRFEFPGVGVLEGDRAVPNSEWLNPGILAQREVIDDFFAIRYGGRLDYVQTNPGEYPELPAEGLRNATQRNFGLISGFVSGDYAVNDVWTAGASIGHGQRAPTLFQLYADRLFVAGYQHGFTTMEGNPNLKEERVTQVDYQMIGDFNDARIMGRAYYAYVENFVTVEWLPNRVVETFPSPVVNGYRFVNSDSYFTGVEYNVDYQVFGGWSVFTNGAYTYGDDIGRFGGAVFGVYPFQTRTGVRFENGDLYRGYGVEFSARMVAAQDRVANTNRGFVAPFQEEQATAGFQTLDLRGYYRATRGMLLTAGVTNLADQAYMEHFDYRTGIGTPQNPSGRVLQPGRNFHFGMEWLY